MVNCILCNDTYVVVASPTDIKCQSCGYDNSQTNKTPAV